MNRGIRWVKHVLYQGLLSRCSLLRYSCCVSADRLMLQGGRSMHSEQISLAQEITKSSSCSFCPCDWGAQAQYSPLTSTVIIQLPPAISIYAPHPATLRRFTNTSITKGDDSNTLFISSCIFSDSIHSHTIVLSDKNSRQFEATDSEAPCSLQPAAVRYQYKLS